MVKLGKEWIGHESGKRRGFLMVLSFSTAGGGGSQKRRAEWPNFDILPSKVLIGPNRTGVQDHV
jgi:hypothetical protein